MNCTLGADVDPAREAVVAYFLLGVLLAVVHYLLACRVQATPTRWVLGLLLWSSCGGCRLVCSGGQFDDRAGKSGEFEDGGIIEEGLLPADLADVKLGGGMGTSLFWPLMWTCSANAVAAQLMQGSWTQLSMSIWSLGLLQRLQVSLTSFICYIYSYLPQQGLGNQTAEVAGKTQRTINQVEVSFEEVVVVAVVAKVLLPGPHPPTHVLQLHLLPLPLLATFHLLLCLSPRLLSHCTLPLSEFLFLLLLLSLCLLIGLGHPWILFLLLVPVALEVLVLDAVPLDSSDVLGQMGVLLPVNASLVLALEHFVEPVCLFLRVGNLVVAVQSLDVGEEGVPDLVATEGVAIPDDDEEVLCPAESHIDPPLIVEEPDLPPRVGSHS